MVFAQLRLLSSLFPFLIFSLPFFSLTLATSTFPSVHIVGSLTSKLPSKIQPTQLSTQSLHHCMR